MPTAYDYSSGPIDPAALKAASVTTVMRYVSTPGNSKNITAAEYRQLAQAGISVGLVYETTATWMLDGYYAGLAAAKSARAQAAAVGYPSWWPIWYAADFDATAAQIPIVLDCLRGCADYEGSKEYVALYGSYSAVEAAYAAGYTSPWQTEAWSAGRWSAHAVLRQLASPTTCGGVQVDVNQITGQLFPATAPVSTPVSSPTDVQLEEEDDMIRPLVQHPDDYAWVPPMNSTQFILVADGNSGTPASVRVVTWAGNAPLVKVWQVGGSAGHRVSVPIPSGTTAVTATRQDAGGFTVGVRFA